MSVYAGYGYVYLGGRGLDCMECVYVDTGTLTSIIFGVGYLCVSRPGLAGLVHIVDINSMTRIYGTMLAMQRNPCARLATLLRYQPISNYLFILFPLPIHHISHIFR